MQKKNRLIEEWDWEDFKYFFLNKIKDSSNKDKLNFNLNFFNV